MSAGHGRQHHSLDPLADVGPGRGIVQAAGLLDQRGRAARAGRSEGGGGDGVQVVRAVDVAGVSLVRLLISPDLWHNHRSGVEFAAEGWSRRSGEMWAEGPVPWVGAG